MPSAPRTNRNRIILVVIVIVCVTLTTLYVRESDQGLLHKAQSFCLDLVSPISSGFAKIFRPIKDGIVNLFHLPSLSRQKRDLEKEVATLRRQSMQSAELESEVDELKRLLKWSEENPDLETVGADIIGQSPDNWQRLMIVNKGSSQGVKKYMSAVTDEGLVGRVISVGSRSSVVQLMTDSRSGIGTRALRTRETGIVEGRNESIVRFTPMSEDAKLEVGDTLVTSGMGGTCPAGIPVGKVCEVKKRTKGLARLIEVRPLVNFTRLDKVLIIIMPEPESVILKGGEVSRKRQLLVAGAVLLAFILQLAVFPQFKLLGATPDLILVIAVVVAVQDGPIEGALVGFFGGLLQDIVSPHVMGVGAFSKALAAFLAGILKDFFMTYSILLPVFLVFVMSLIGQSLHQATLAMLGQEQLPPFRAGTVLASSLYDVLAVFVVYPVMKRLRFQDRDDSVPLTRPGDG